MNQLVLSNKKKANPKPPTFISPQEPTEVTPIIDHTDRTPDKNPEPDYSQPFLLGEVNPYVYGNDQTDNLPIGSITEKQALVRTGVQLHRPSQLTAKDIVLTAHGFLAEEVVIELQHQGESWRYPAELKTRRINYTFFRRYITFPESVAGQFFVRAVSGNLLFPWREIFTPYRERDNRKFELSVKDIGWDDVNQQRYIEVSVKRPVGSQVTKVHLELVKSEQVLQEQSIQTGKSTTFAVGESIGLEIRAYDVNSDKPPLTREL